MATIVEAIKTAEAFYKAFRKAHETIPLFYRELGHAAAVAYFRRVIRKRPTAHWHLDYDGVRYWFWRRWDGPGIAKSDSKEYVTTMLPRWEKHGIAHYKLWFHSFNQPIEVFK